MIDELIEKISKALDINSDRINLSRVPGGWFADVYLFGKNIEGDICNNSELALESLFKKIIKNKSKF